MNKTISYIHFDTIDSTNTWAKANAHLLNPVQITCITASEQTGGRGRFKRRWLSPRGDNIYMTLFFCIPKESPYLSNLGQILAYSFATLLREKGIAAELKWPNDILIEEKKVGGVLSEIISLEDRIGVCLGIGININMDEKLLKTIDQPATSLKGFSRQEILDLILKQFLHDLEILQKKGFAAFQSAFNRLLAFKGKKMAYGLCHGVTEKGHLQVLLPSGKTTTIVSEGLG